MNRIEQIKTFLNETPNDAFLKYALATEYIALGQDLVALNIFLELLKNHTDYFATYYHIGKLYERLGEDTLAEEAYIKGMEITKRLNEKHAHGELRGAYEELTY